MKILIACPTCDKYRYCLQEYLDAVKNLEHPEFEFDLLLVDNSKTDEFFKELKSKGINTERVDFLEDFKERIVNSRNLLLQRAIEGNYDYLFSLEQDIIIKKDTLSKLLAAEKGIIGAYYGTATQLVLQDKETGKIVKAVVDMPIVWLDAGGRQIKRANPAEVMNKGIMQVGGIGLGCVLISREVFAKIKFRYEKESRAFDDMLFCKDAKNLGFKIFLHSDIQAKHLHKDENMR